MFVFAAFLLCSATANRLLQTSQGHTFAFSALGEFECPSGFEPVTQREECRQAIAYAKCFGLEECGLEGVECKDKRNLGRKRGYCMGRDMTVPKPKIYVSKARKFRSTSRLLCKKVEVDTTTSPPGPCVDNNAVLDLVLPTLVDFPQKKLASTSTCEFVVGFLDASSGAGTGCFLFGDYCCETCTTQATGGFSLGYASEHRYWKLTIFMAEVFTLEVDEYQGFLAAQTYFDKASVVTVPTVGVYSGPENIIEYFLVQNPHFTDERHYIDPTVEADITLVEATETAVEFQYLATAPNFYILGEPFSRLEAHFRAEYSDSGDFIIDNLTVDFLERDVMAVANSVGTAEELCTQMEQSCTGRLAQFSCFSECVAYMSALPLTKPECPTLKGPTLACRWTHMILAQPSLRPEVHCFHVGPENPDPFDFIKCSIADC